MAKMIIHKSILGYLKIDGEIIDTKVKELEIAEGVYDLTPGLEHDDSGTNPSWKDRYNRHIIWGMREKVEINEKFIYHVYIKRKPSLLYIAPRLKVKKIEKNKD